MSRKVTVAQLRQAIALAQAGCTFREAAEQTGFTVPQLAALERRENVRFRRDKRQEPNPLAVDTAVGRLRETLAPLQGAATRTDT